MNNNIIYAYKRKTTNQVVYVGQTVCLSQRHKTHIEYDPYNPNNPEYNYPLSRGIRKYGPDEYELIILENNIPQEKLDEREKYWIDYYDTFYNGYNQSLGGKNPVVPKYDEKLINLVYTLLKDPENRFKDISQKTGLSLTHIYNLNMGLRRKKDGIKYPIRQNNSKGTRGLKFSQDDCEQIHQLLVSTHKTYKEIAKIYGCSPETISDISRGKTQAYRLNGYNYPIR